MAKQNKEAIFDKLIQVNLPSKEKETISESIKDKIIILDELKDFIPPLNIDEFNLLEANILAEGCRDALVLWQQGDKYVLVDGHNRYQICSKHKIDFKYEIKEFLDIEAVKDWMFSNQLGKRNLTEEAKSYLRGIQYKREKKKVGGTGSNQFSKEEKFSPQLKTAQKLAEVHKVSDRTIKNDEQYSEMVDKISGSDKKLKWDILNKTIVLNKGLVNHVNKLKDKELDAIRQILKEKGTYKPNQSKAKSSPTEFEKQKQLIIKSLSEMISNKNPQLSEKIIDLVKELADLLA